uniref:Uncharacterized protein n=1 Tax=Oryza punctata TaxID=4537 RepID=A0A0E0JY06_ORYPU
MTFEKFLWAKFKMQGDVMILLSDITLQVKIKLPYTDMMVHFGFSENEIRPQFTAQVHPNKTMFNTQVR